VKKLQPDKLEPKAEKCVFIGYPKERTGYTLQIRRQSFSSQEWILFGEGFFSKYVSGRKVELEEVIEPSVPEMVNGTTPETVPVVTSPNVEGTNDGDHETPKEDTTVLRRSTRRRTTPNLYVLIMNVMVAENDDPAAYDEAMMRLDSDKWIEAMKSEMGSMYENQVLTLVDLPNDRKTIENKWILGKKTYADGNVTYIKLDLSQRVFN
jgi:hypothetical protein